VSNISKTGASNEPRILLFSHRNVFNNHFRCANYEFEDNIREIDSVTFLAPEPNKLFKIGTRIAQRLARDLNIFLNPGIPKTELEKSYDLFFVACSFPRDLLNIKGVERWRDRCRIAICWLNEIWASEVYKSIASLELLKKFDYVIINCSQSVDAVNEVIGDKCLYLSPGVDAMLFCPYPAVPRRVIDVYSIGRRSEKSHRSLLRMGEGNRIFYVYDSMSGSQVMNTSQHRLLFANMAKRSRYFIVNPGKIDCPEETNHQSEIGPRYFEGSSSGTIMIGEYPKNEEFEQLFDWPDAVIHLPFDSEEIESIINDLDSQPERQERIRRNNVVNSLLRHDWVYRWEEILKIAGLEPMPGLLERKKRLENLADLAGREKLLSDGTKA
jgi:hypothetical protein